MSYTVQFNHGGEVTRLTISDAIDTALNIEAIKPRLCPRILRDGGEVTYEDGHRVVWDGLSKQDKTLMADAGLS